MNLVQTFPAGGLFAPRARAIKKLAKGASFYTLRASRAVRSVSAALPNSHPDPVKYEPFCV